MDLQPLGDRLIVEVLDEEEQTVSGIVLPDTAKEKPQRGRVLAVGPGTRDEDGEFVGMEVAEGDEIVFSKYGGTEIKVGSDEYFVTGISSSTVATSTDAIVTPNFELTPFFSGVALDVMPQIDEQGNVLMHIHPSVIDVTEQTKTIDLGSTSSSGTTTTYNLPMAYSNIRESDTVVQAKSGDVIVIGGLMRINKEQKVSKVPWIGDIPWVGEAFTNRTDSTYKTELVIMLKPQVIEGDTWQRELQRSSELLDKWYPEGR